MNVINLNKKIIDNIMDINELSLYEKSEFISLENEFDIIKKNKVETLFLNEDTRFYAGCLNLDFIESFIRRYNNILKNKINQLSDDELLKIYKQETSLFDINLLSEISDYFQLSNILIKYFLKYATDFKIGDGRNLKQNLLLINDENIFYTLHEKRYDINYFFNFKEDINKTMGMFIDKKLALNLFTNVELHHDCLTLKILLLDNLNIEQKHIIGIINLVENLFKVTSKEHYTQLLNLLPIEIFEEKYFKKTINEFTTLKDDFTGNMIYQQKLSLKREKELLNYLGEKKFKISTKVKI